MTIHQHAMSEFRAAKFVDENGNYSDPMQKEMCEHILSLLDVFADEGHSGFSASYAIDMFSKLAKFEPLVPLTGEDWEWNEICDERTGGISVHQNNRCSRIFKQSDRFDGKPYDINAVVFYDWVTDEETGEKYKSCFTNSDSFQVIEFPYTPKTEYRERIAK
jgi:hypothetical protein